MPAADKQLGLSRRVLALHLLSSVAALAAFATGAAATLRSGLVADPTAAQADHEPQSLARLAAAAAPALAAGLIPIGLGAWFLRRLTLPLSGVASQLEGIACAPYGEPPKPDRLPGTSRAAVGWNRIADRLREAERWSQAGGPRAQLALLAQQGGGRVKAALDSLPEGVAVTDAEGRIDFANRAIQALLGTDAEVEGASIEELLRRACPAAADAFAAVGVAELPLGAVGRTLRVERAPIQGEPAGAVWSVRDVTQQKMAEASRDQFIDTATHELRTPLANIRAYAETLAMGAMTDVEQQKEFCNTINAEATRLSRFVDDLLSISSLEVGSLGAERQNVDVRRLIEEAAAKVKPLATQKSLSFQVTLAEKLGEALLDKDKVSGMLVNLLGNAVKYTPDGGAVTLSAVREADAIAIDVTDTGVGIAPEEHPKVFEKFFRSENPQVQDQIGTGLGLALAREIARLHGGDLTLQSTLGEGATFTATLPVR
ncbi:ATP-binding protein [Botrimarina sp.]|uniref:sensor histidine kinase n=1 Tax=Botrimarina sp. TaxID=2795802 RepID=UPI0032EB029A